MPSILARMTALQETLSKNIRTLRKQRGFTQEALAEAASLSLQTVQKLETKTTWASPETLHALAKALGISDTLLFFDVEDVGDFVERSALDWVKSLRSSVRSHMFTRS